MAQAAEGSEGSSVANSSSNYWDLQTNFVSSWTNTIPTWHPPPNNPNSNSSCEEEISNSFTNTSNHSGLSDVSSCHRKLVVSAGGRQPSREPTENLLWNQVLRNVGSNGDLNHGRYVEENFLEALTLSSKNLPTNMYEPACDYLKKMDNGWEFPISPSFNNLDKQLNSFSGSLLEHQRLGNLSNLVSNWSIALPLPESNCQVSTTTPSTTCDRDISMDSFHQQYSSSCGILEGIRSDNSGMFPCYEHELLKNQQEEIESLNHASFQSFKANSIRNQMSNNCLGTGENNKSYFCSIPEVPLLKNNSKNLSDVISFNGFLNKPVMDIQQPSKQSLKPTNSSETKKHGHENSLSARGRGKGSGITSGEGKKKRSEENSETVFKKPKQETSTVSSVKGQATKVKLGDRITALQQIVSPFGKTDTASVLQEAIGYIKFLQEQVQLLSNPYVKVNTINKDPWGLLERKDKAEAKVDLRSRGLCLVPISCTPQVYRENNGSDYWTPTYRGSLYR